MTKHRNDVYQDKHGTWWARVNGVRKTGNSRKYAWALHDEMLDEHMRAAIARQDEGAPRLGSLEVIILRGAPGCGKTTWARAYIAEHPWFKRISRDSLREMFDFGDYTTPNEKFIRAIRYTLIRECLEAKHPVIVDDTNLNDRDIREINSAAHVYSQVIGQVGYFPIPTRIVDVEATLAECIARDAARPLPVGAARVTELYAKWEHSIDRD